MGSACCKKYQAVSTNNPPPISLQKIANDKKNFVFTHSKHYERYFNRQFKVSVCSAKGERMKMEDDHSCVFTLSNHPNYSFFAVFDGHHGPKASKYLADNLYKTLNDINDLENNENIISAIKKMDKEFILTPDGMSGSTIVFAIISSDVASSIDLNRIDSIHKMNEQKMPSINHQLHSKKSYGAKKHLTGFEIEYHGRVFWVGDSRCFSIKSLNTNKPTFDSLTNDHNTKNQSEIQRIEKLNGKIIKGRVDGKLAVTRSFGDKKMKYDGSVVTCECEYTSFNTYGGDSLLLCCDGLTEKWSDKRLIERLKYNLYGRNQNSKDMDTAKAIGDLVDDAIYEGSDDNISVMFIQFKDGTKQKMNKRYENV